MLRYLAVTEVGRSEAVAVFVASRLRPYDAVSYDD